MSGECEKCGEHCLECSCNDQDEGTCELVIHCHNCKANFQLNPQMIALALAAKTDIWEIYNYILTIKCKNCSGKSLKK